MDSLDPLDRLRRWCLAGIRIVVLLNIDLLWPPVTPPRETVVGLPLHPGRKALHDFIDDRFIS